MRKELEPDFETAKKLYPKILDIITDYADYFCFPSDSRRHSMQFRKLKNKLHEIMGENFSDGLLCPYDSVVSTEEYAIELSLPLPPIVKDITKEELTEILSFIASGKSTIIINGIEFDMSGFYINLLEKNFSNFTSDWIFYPELVGIPNDCSIEELVEKILYNK